MFAVCFEDGAIKRRMRWISPKFHTYLRRGDRVLPNISRCILIQTLHRAGGKRAHRPHTP